jgi:hypothetical protein
MRDGPPDRFDDLSLRSSEVERAAAFRQTRQVFTLEDDAMPKSKHRCPKWLRDTEVIDAAIDATMERIRKRDGRKAYENASHDLLTFFTNTIVHMDGSPKRLLGMLRRLETSEMDFTASRS